MAIFTKLKKAVKKGVSLAKKVAKKGISIVKKIAKKNPVVLRTPQPVSKKTKTVLTKVTKKAKTAVKKVAKKAKTVLTKVTSKDARTGLAAGVKLSTPGGKTPTPEGGGWKNVAAVYAAPFTKNTTVTAPEVENHVIRWGLEKAANNPLTTAAVLTGLYGAGKLVVGTVAGKLAAGRMAVRTGEGLYTANYAANTVTQKLTGNILAKAGFTIGAASAIIGAAGTYPFAKFELAEAMDKIGIARWKAIEADRLDLLPGLDQLQQEILNPQGWDKILQAIPFTNVYNSVSKNIDAAVASTKVFDKIIEDAGIEESDGEKWVRIREEEAEQDKAAVDYYNDERQKLVQWELEAKAAARAAERETDRKANVEAARFWAKERELQRKKEAEDRQAIADFWTAYRKAMQKIADDNRPSNLKFGLL